MPAVRDKIFHELAGEDGHGYCRTYGTGVPRSAIYGHGTSSFISSDAAMVAEITRQVTEAVEEQVTRRVKESLEEQFRLEFEQMHAQIKFLESQGGIVDVSEDVNHVPDVSSEHRS